MSAIVVSYFETLKIWHESLQASKPLGKPLGKPLFGRFFICLGHGIGQELDALSGPLSRLM